MEQEQQEKLETRGDGKPGRNPPPSPPYRWLGGGPRWPLIANAIASYHDCDGCQPLRSLACCFGRLISSLKAVSLGLFGGSFGRLLAEFQVRFWRIKKPQQEDQIRISDGILDSSSWISRSFHKSSIGFSSSISLFQVFILVQLL